MTPNPQLPWCCFIDCAKTAEFHIYTQRLRGGMVGPDIYGDETDSCDEHVGKLLGWQPEAKDVTEIGWVVVQLALQDPA